MHRTARVGSLLTASVLLLAGCTGTTAHRPPETSSTPTHPATSSPAPAAPAIQLVRSGSPLRVTWVDPSTATTAKAGRDYQVLSTTPAAQNCKNSLSPIALRPDGSWLTFQVPAKNCTYDGGQWLPAWGRIGLYTRAGFTPWQDTRRLSPTDHPRQTWIGSATSSVAVWEETESANLEFDNWRIMAGNPDTGATHLVAKSEEIYDGTLPQIAD